jgi:predicted enzyme related to lactoylglutathione lyase
MADPFEALREPVPSVAPDPIFAAGLRARLVRALDLPRGVTVSALHVDPTAPPTSPQEGDLAYVSLWVPDEERAAEFFGAVLGWRIAGGTGGTPGRARQILGQSLPHGILGGQPESTLFLSFVVADLDSALERVAAAGGQAGDPRDERYGRTASCSDDQGVRFALVELPAGAGDAPVLRGQSNGERHGDVSYLTMEVVDSARARAFYGAVLGWRFNPGRVPDGWQNDGVVPMLGMAGGHSPATVVPMYRVDDIVGAVARVRARGGTATDPDRQSYGVSATCTDDQGTRFYLHQP